MKNRPKTKSKTKKKKKSGRPVQRKQTPFENPVPFVMKKSTGAKKDRSLIRKMAKNFLNKNKSKSKRMDKESESTFETMSETLSDAAPVVALGGLSNFFKISSVALLAVLVILAYFYFKANPKACIKRKCSSKTHSSDIVVVATNLNTNCSPSEKSMRTKQIINDTLNEIDYDCKKE